jgi:arabinan endo-1,5-alpha-L-arabinosidase
MKSRFLAGAFTTLLTIWSSGQASALDGEPFIHDPSTVLQCDGKYYCWGTGGSGLVSEDGWTWHGGARVQAGAAPDLIHIGDCYYMAYASSGGGLGGNHASTIRVKWSKTLDPGSPDYGWNDDHVVAASNGVEDCDAIDPGFLLDPTDGRLWVTYGTYFGFIRIVELDPKTGHHLEANQPVNIAIDCEATDPIYRDGWYYLLGTHGTCCDGANSTYNIRVGRSKKITGPFVDNLGNDMIKGGGKLVVAASGRYVGPGHFGLMDLGDGVEKFTCHYEADLDHGGRSVLDIRPLLWKDGWPVAGDNFKEGTYEIQSERTGYALEMGVEFVRMAGGGRGGFGGGGRRGGGGGPGGAPGGTNAPGGLGGPGAGVGFGGGRGGGGLVTPIPAQSLAQVSSNWPASKVDVRLGDFMFRPHQEWTITAVTNSSGFPGSPCFKITIAGTERALAATADAEVVTVPAYTGQPEQLWRIDQLTDGTYRIMPKVVPNSTESLVLTAIGYSTPTLAKFDPSSDKSRWNFRAP